MENGVNKGLSICRACLESSRESVDLETPLFLYESDGFEQIITYLDCFNQCTQLSASLDDEYPKYLCGSCGLELKSAYEFIVKARHSHELLQTRWEMNEQPIIEDESNTKGTIVHDSGNDSIVDKKLIINEKEIQKYSNEVKIEDTKIEPVEEEEEEEEDENEDEDIYETQYLINEINDNPKSEIDHAGSETGISLNMIKSENNHDNENDVGYDGKENEDDEKGDDDENHSDKFLVYSCEICSEKFHYLQSLQDHYTLQHPEYGLHYECDQCDNRFFSKSALNLHVKRIHLKVEYVDCEICGRTVLKTWLDKHIRKMHEKRREYLCSSCPRIFKNHASLKKHMQTHQKNRERKFQCAECDKKFYTIENYRVHQTIHLKPSERKSFECSLCDKSFVRNTNLKLHMQMHRGETMDCPHCAKKFVRKKDMEIHIRFHTGNYPFKCSFCDKRYAIKGHLKYHERKHAGYKYKCETCSKEFINLSGLRQHSYEHTGMPLFCLICSKGFPSRFKVKRHITSVHHIESNVDVLISKKDNRNGSQKTDENEEGEEVYEEVFLVDEFDMI